MDPKDSSSSSPTRRFYDRISHVYDHLADRSEHESRERGLDLLDARPGERILEVGFGTGHALESLAQTVGDGGRVVGIDLSQGMREVARRRLEDAGLLSRVELILGDARNPNLPPPRFDAVFSSFTLELFEEPDLPRVLEVIRESLVPGGRLAAVSMLEKEPHSAMVDLYHWLHRHFPHIVDCRPIDLVGALERAGFRLADSSETSIMTLPVIEVLAYRD